MSRRPCRPLAALILPVALLCASRVVEAGGAEHLQQLPSIESVRSDSSIRSDSASRTLLQLRFEARSDSARSYHVAHQRVSQPVMAHRFRVAMPDSLATLDAPNAPSWQAVLRVHGRDVGSQLRFSRDEREVTLPRPLGVALRTGDSLTLEVYTEGRATSRIVLLVTVDYEPVDRRGGRMSVDPVSADLAPDGNARSVSWEFSPESGGRVLAVCGALLARATSIELVNVASGEVLWSLTVPASAQRNAIGTGGVVRLGVPVRATETYRFTVVLDAVVGAETTALAATAMVLPQRAR